MKRVVLAAALVLSFCPLPWHPEASAADFSAWQHRMPIRFSGYDKGEALTNFPVLVRLSEGLACFSYDQFALPRASDLRFADSTETVELAYEVEEWNTNGESIVWVKVPELADTNSTVYAYWGNAAASATVTPDAVQGLQLWLKADAGVQTNAAGGVTNWVDQSSASNDAVRVATNNSITRVDSAVNGLPVLNFVYADGSDYLDTGWTPTDLDNLTVFAVSRPTTAGFPTSGSIFKAVVGSGDPGAGDGKFIIYSPRTNIGGLGYAGHGRERTTGFTSSGNDDGDVHIAVLTITGNDLANMTLGAYYDGALSQTDTSTDPAPANGAVLIGAGAGLSSRRFHGDIAEILVYKRALSEAEMNVVGDYLKTRYALTAIYDVPAPPYTFDGSTWREDFAAVYHLDETARDRLDVTANGHDATALSVSGPAAQGVVNGADAFGGTGSGDRLRPNSPDPGFFHNAFAERTFSAWVTTDSVAGPNILYDEGGNTHGFAVAYRSGPGTFVYAVRQDGTKTEIASTTTVPGTSDAFTHLTAVYDGGNMRLYVNGVLESTAAPGGGIPAHANDPGVGGATETTALNEADHPWHGVVDEVRISGVSRSSNWVWATYMNSAPEHTFMTYGHVEGVTNPLVSNAGGASSVGIYDANLNGELACTGAAATAVWVYLGATNGETDPFSWDVAELVGTNVQVGPLSFSASNLTAETTYFYRYYASNAVGAAWASSSASFTTLPAVPEVTNDGGASNITTTSANLNGALTSTGAAATAVSVFWGLSNGGTDKAAWANTNSFGLQPPPGEAVPPAYALTTNITGLLSDTVYYYRYYASNEFGEAWAPASVTFVTLSDSADYPVKMPITFSGYDKAALTNFPALVILNESLPGFQYDHFASRQGYDLRFFADDQTTTLPYEIEDWNPEGDSHVWVQVPVLTNGAGIYVGWGNTNLVAEATPPDVPGLQLWLKADGGVQTNGSGSVTNWVDQSGQGRDATSSAAANGPTITPAVVNGLPVLSFDSLDDVLSYDGTFLANTDYTVFIIEGRASAGSNWFMGGADGAQRNLHAGYRDNTTVTTAHWNNDINVGVAGFTGQVFHVWAFHLDSTDGNGRTLLLDGTPIGATADNTQLVSYNGAALGGLPAIGSFFTGDIAEVIVYNRNLTEAEKGRMGLYLADKYGLDVAYDPVEPPPYTTDGSTWDPGFVGVWHLEEEVTDEAAAGVHEDSTANGNDGSQNGNDDTPAVVADGQAFDGNDYVDVGDVMPAGAYTKLAWVRRTASGARNILSGDANHAFWAPPTLGSQLSAGHNGIWTYVQDPVVLAQDEWFQVAVSFDPAVNSGEMVLYKNGVEVDRATGVPTQDDSTTTYISRFGTGHYWVGDIDEVRMSSVARGSNWVCAVYANVASNAAFMTYGQVQGLDTPIVSNDGGASNVLYTSAVLNGDLVSTGAAAAEVFVYWGASDGGTDPLSWDEFEYFDVQGQDTLLTTNITGLAAETMYYYRFFASNTAGGAWAGTTESFMTVRGRPTITNNGGASNVTDTAADLVGDLVSTGAAATEVTVFWGASEGGTDPFSWDTPAALGTQGVGQVVYPASGLNDGTTYFYRYYATNSFGEDWVDSSAMFTTPLTLNPTFSRLKITFSGYDKAPLTNFPSLVVLNETLSNFSYRTFASTSGADLRFWDATETVELYYEIEEWDALDNSYVWVQVPELTNGTCIYAKWGDTNDLSAFDSPDDIPGLVAWYDAGFGVVTGVAAEVTTWSNRVGTTSLDLTNSDGDKPTLMEGVVNGLPVADFDGNDRISGGATNFNQPNTILAVVRVDVANGGYVFDGTTSDARHAGFARGDAAGWDAYAGTELVDNAAVNTGVFEVHAWVFNGANGEHYINGRRTAMGDVDTNAFRSVILGARFSQTDFLDGAIAEFLVYDGLLSTADRNAVGYYLAQKYGMTTDYGDPAFPLYTHDGSTWTEGYRAVWHLASDAPGKDATSTGADGTLVGVTDASGIIDGAQAFTDPNHIRFGNTASLSGPIDFTVSSWVRTSVSGAAQVVLQQRNGGFNGQWRVQIQGDNKVYFYVYQNDNQFNFPSVETITDGAWHQVTAVRQGSNGYIYVDGNLSSTASGPIRSLNADIGIGMGRNIRDDNSNFEGDIDESRISALARGSNWVCATYLTVASNSSFGVYGSVEDLSTGNDTDGDGMDDDWEEVHCPPFPPGCDPDDQTGDGDGLTYGQEYVLDYNPAASNMLFAFEAFSLGSVNVTFGETTTNRVYRLEATTDLTAEPPVWVVVQSDRAGSNGVTTVTDTNDFESREYRVLVPIP